MYLATGVPTQTGKLFSQDDYHAQCFTYIKCCALKHRLDLAIYMSMCDPGEKNTVDNLSITLHLLNIKLQCCSQIY